MEKSEVISRVRTERNRWSEIMARIDDDLMLKPGVEGDWSAKDILAHNTFNHYLDHTESLRQLLE